MSDRSINSIAVSMSPLFRSTPSFKPLSQPPHRPSNILKNRSAFTLVELLVVIAIIGVLIGMMAPSVQAIRESSRRSECQMRLMPIGIAIESYHDRWLHYPVGTMGDTAFINSEAIGNHHNWLGRLTDLLDQPVIASHIDRTVGIYDIKNEAVLKLSFPAVKCPSDAQSLSYASSYVGLHHPSEKPISDTDDGVFIMNIPVNREDVTDGLSNTAFVSEKCSSADDLGWLSGTRATLRNVGGGIQISAPAMIQSLPADVGSIGSRHPAGAHLMLGSGEIRFLSTQTDHRVLIQLVDRRDGLIPLHFQSIDVLRRQSLQ